MTLNGSSTKTLVATGFLDFGMTLFGAGTGFAFIKRHCGTLPSRGMVSGCVPTISRDFPFIG